MGKIRTLIGSNQSGIQPQEWQVIQRAAQANRLNPNLLRSLIMAESGGRHQVGKTISSAGALGYGQLMPGTARGLGVNPWDAEQNITGAARYLAQQMRTFQGNVRKALAAYNAGPGAVQKYGGVPPYAETQAYVDKVIQLMGSGGGGSMGPSGGAAAPAMGNPAPASGITDEQLRARAVGPISSRVVEEQISRRGMLGDMMAASPEMAGMPDGATSGALRAGGGWGGSRGVATGAYQVAKEFGATIVSEKRDTKNTASGGVSDHWTGSKGSWATDIGATGAKGDKIAQGIAAKYGMSWKPGSWASKTISVNGKKYRLQLGWRVPDHFDHVHFGVKLVG